jgi:hypothetical protein
MVILIFISPIQFSNDIFIPFTFRHFVYWAALNKVIYDAWIVRICSFVNIECIFYCTYKGFQQDSVLGIPLVVLFLEFHSSRK